MNIPIFGSITNAMSMKKLEIKWNQRKNEITQFKLVEDPMVKRMKEELARIKKNNDMAAIVSKLKSGSALAPREMSFLRMHAPDLYEDALKIELERKQYKRDLERCRSKEDVDRLNNRKMMQFYNEAKNVMSNSSLTAEQKVEKLEKISMRMAAIQKEHLEFAMSPEYASLPDKDEEDEDENGLKTKKPPITSPWINDMEFRAQLAGVGFENMFEWFEEEKAGEGDVKELKTESTAKPVGSGHRSNSQTPDVTDNPRVAISDELYRVYSGKPPASLNALDNTSANYTVKA